MHIDYFYLCRLGFELFLLKFLSLWFAKLYQFKYILKQLAFVLVNLALYGVFNREAFKLSRLSILPYAQCLLFPLTLASIDNFMLQNFIPLMLIATFQCFWIRLNHRKLATPLFTLLTLLTTVRLFISLPGYGLFFIVLAQCVTYAFIQFTQKRRIFSIYVLFSQGIVFLVSIVLPKYNSILDFRRFHVFTHNVVFVDSVNKLFVNLFYHLVLFLFGLFLTLYSLSLYQGDKFKLVNGSGFSVLLLHLTYRLLHFLFIDTDNNVSNFNVLLEYVLEYNTVVFILFCVLTTLVIFTAIGLNIKYAGRISRSRSAVRKWFHVLILLFCYYAFYLKMENFLALLMSLVIVFFVFIELFRINNLLLKPVAKFLTDLYKCLGHDSQVDKFEISTISMMLGLLVPILFELGNEKFDWTRGGLGIFTVGVGDSIASIVGVKYRGNRHNGKTVQGMMGFFLSCLAVMVATSLFQHGSVIEFRRMFFVSFFCSVFEYVTDQEDNVSIPMLAVLLYRL